MELDTAMKIAIMAIMPYSAGVKRRANIRPTKKVTPELDMLSIKLHFAPWTALFFKDSGNIVTNYYSISSTSDACTNVVATAITPSMFTTTLLSWRTRTNTPSTPSKMPPVIRTRVPWERFSSVGSR